MIEGRPNGTALHTVIFISNGELLIWLVVKLIMELNLEEVGLLSAPPPPWNIVKALLARGLVRLSGI